MYKQNWKQNYILPRYSELKLKNCERTWKYWNFFEYIIKKHKTLTDNQSIKICINKIENRIIFWLDIMTYNWKIVNVLENTENRITKDKNGVSSL